MNSKINWTHEEQHHLAELFEKQKKPNWKVIAQNLNSFFQNRSRTPKQCRQRYINFVKIKDQRTSQNEWSSNQSSTLFEQYLEKGSKWVQISKLLPGRSENAIKNRFYGSVRKFLRRINQIQRQSSIRSWKLLKQCTIMKLLEAQTWFSLSKIHDQQTIKFILNLRYKILEILKQLENQPSKQELLQLISSIIKFKSITRFQTSKKIKNIHNMQKKQSFTQNDLQGSQISYKTEKLSCDQREDNKQEEKELMDKEQHHQYELVEEASNMELQQYVKVDVHKDLPQELSLMLDLNYQTDKLEFLDWN